MGRRAQTSHLRLILAHPPFLFARTFSGIIIPRCSPQSGTWAVGKSQNPPASGEADEQERHQLHILYNLTSYVLSGKSWLLTSTSCCSDVPAAPKKRSWYKRRPEPKTKTLVLPVRGRNRGRLSSPYILDVNELRYRLLPTTHDGTSP